MCFFGRMLRSDWPHVLRDINLFSSKTDAASKHALLYYKTEPFVMPWKVSNYRHTNLWEIVEMVRILNRYGYTVDIVDRDATRFFPQDTYELFLGLGAGHSGKRFSEYAKRMPSATKVLIAAGPEPELSNTLVLEQYERFNRRHDCKVSAMRLTEGIDFGSFSRDTDYFLSIGEPHTFCPQSYAALGKPVLNYLPSTSPYIRFLPEWFETRSRRAFLCFAGDGFICKGVDVVVDAFTSMEDADLYICGPASEPSFFEVFGAKLRQSLNIHYEGFIKIGSPRFEYLTAHCAYVILASSSEGCATSVATVMRAGLMPVLTKETGIDIDHFGIYINGEKKDLVDETIIACRRAIEISDNEYRQRVWQCVEDSKKYTQASFSETFDRALLTILGHHKRKQVYP